MRVPYRFGALMATAILVVASILIFRSLRGESWPDQASDLMDAAWRGDTGTLFRFCMPEDITRNKMDAAKIGELWRGAVTPHLKRFRREKGVVKSLLTSQGAAIVRAKDSKGYEVVFEMAPWITDDGLKQQLQMFMMQAWINDYCAERGVPLTRDNQIRAILSCYAEHQALLRSLGVEYLVDYKHDLSKPTKTWAQVVVDLKNELTDLQIHNR